MNKLDAFGFDKNAIVNSYLTNRNQRVKVNDKHSPWSEILSGFPQGSILILDPFLFNVFICDMFYFLKDFEIATATDDSTPYTVDKNIEFVVNNLEQLSSILFEWLTDNYIKVKTGKSHLLVSGNVRAMANIDNHYIES